MKVKVIVIGVVVLVAGVLVIALLPREQRVTECGIDASGRPYAKVRIMNLSGGYHSANWTGVTFSFGGARKSDDVGFERPAHTITTTTVHSHVVLEGSQSRRALTCSTWKNY